MPHAMVSSLFAINLHENEAKSILLPGCTKTISGIRYKVCSHRASFLAKNLILFQCMYPECPDYDLCENCEALPIPVHPPIHPMLKMKTADTVVPTVYRVGQTCLIDRASPALPSTIRSESRASTPVAEERVRTPKAVPPLPAWMALAPALSDDESPASVASSVKPPLPPKPEMMSNPPWASIQSLFPSQRLGEITNPFADTFAAPSETRCQDAEESYREVDISLPSVPSHIPNPWPTNNAAERQELLQLIYDFAGPSTSASVVSSLSDAPHRSTKEQGETFVSKAPLVDLSSVESSMYTDPSKNEAQEQSIAQEAEVQAFLPNLPLPASGDLFNSLFQHIEDVVASQNIAAGDVTRTEYTQENFIEETIPEPRTSFGNFSVSMSHLLQEMENLNFVPVARPETFSVNDNVPQGEIGKAESVTESTLSREALLKSPEQKRSLIERMPHSLVDLMQSFEAIKPQAQAVAEITVEQRIPLSAAFVEDVTVPDGQVFPPGAEFVKCWRLLNDSGRDWPESTELVFVAGELLSSEKNPAALAVLLGKVAAGTAVDAWTGELKVRYFV